MHDFNQTSQNSKSRNEKNIQKSSIVLDSLKQKAVIENLKKCFLIAITAASMSILPAQDEFAKENHLEIVHYLLAYGSDLNAKNSGDDIPLYLAVENENFLIMNLLLNRAKAARIQQYKTEKTSRKSCYKCTIL
jgi:hypothetical protein